MKKRNETQTVDINPCELQESPKAEVIGAGDWYDNYVVFVKVGKQVLVFGSDILVDGM